MLPQFLLPETTVREGGSGPEIQLNDLKGGSFILTFGITRIVAQESIDLSIWGSVDGREWSSRPIITFPQKFYCGTYQVVLDLTDHPEVGHLRVKWGVNRWGRGQVKPLFGIYVFLQGMKPAVMAAG